MDASASGSVSFLTLRPGTPVVDRFGEPVGTVARVLVLENEEFDGIVVETSVGRRFVDAPEVRRISSGAVTLASALADVDCARSVSSDEVFIMRFADGRIGETWGVGDVVSQLRQLGALPVVARS